MPVISNTSPLLNLAIIGHLSLLQEQFQTILIPDAVYNELQVNTNLPGSVALHSAIQTGWIQQAMVENFYTVQVLQVNLDRGESEAIVLALERRVSRILMDENDGRTMAQLMGLQPIGVLGILLRAKQSGRIPAIKPLIQQLRDQAGFFINPTLSVQVLRAAGEK